MRGRREETLESGRGHGAGGRVGVVDVVLVDGGQCDDVAAAGRGELGAVEADDDGKRLFQDPGHLGPVVPGEVAQVEPAVARALALLVEGLQEGKPIAMLDVHVGQVLPGEGVDGHGHAGLAA